MDAKKTGKLIAALRKEKGWSQTELARRLHISPSAVGMYEQGRREPSLQGIVEIGEVFGVSTDYLLTGCRNSADYTVINGKLDKVSPEKYDKIMRIMDIVLEE